MENFIEELKRYYDEAFISKKESLNETDLMSNNDKISKGYILTELTAKFIQNRDYYGNPCFNSAILTFNNKEDFSKFKIGDPVKIIRNDIEFSGMVIIEILEDNITVERTFNPYSWDLIISNSLIGSNGWEIHPDIIDMRGTYEKCTSYLINNHDKLEEIYQILYNESRIPDINEKPYISPVSNLNPSQLESFENARNAQDYYLIQGPPGTGKTTVLAELALAFAKEGKSVLITGPTNTSINNAIENIGKLNNDEVPIFRVWSRRSKIESAKLEKYNVKNVSSFSEFDVLDTNEIDDNKLSSIDGYIVGSTCFHIYTKRINKLSGDWDVVIFDESSQLTIPLSILPLSKSKKWIFVGDHKQLPPIQDTKSQLFKLSIFETLHSKFKGTMLSETYRMHENINRFPSNLFYNGLLTSSIKENLDITSGFKKYHQILDINKSEVVVIHNHTFYPSRSLFEANLISDLIKEYYDNNISLNRISVISPFRTQVKQVKNSLKRYFDEVEIENIFVDTIERMQGQENDIVIISYGVSDPENDKLRLSYLFNLQRFNVAITRSKMKRIFIASKRVFDTNYENPNVNILTSVFHAFLNDSYVIDLSEKQDDEFNVFN